MFQMTRDLYMYTEFGGRAIFMKCQPLRVKMNDFMKYLVSNEYRSIYTDFKGVFHEMAP